MARVKKKIKKEKTEGSKRNSYIIGGIAGGLALCCIIGFIVVLLIENITPKLYKNSRDMDYDTLVEMLDDRDTRQGYEGTIYIFVFHSDYESEEFSDYSISDGNNSRIKTAINNDIRLNSLYNSNKIEQKDRYGFYAIDLMDEANYEILADEKLGHDSGKPYIITISGYTNNTISKSTSIATLVGDTINNRLTSEIAKFQ